MLEKIISIIKIGRFVNCKASGDVSFGKCSLIFGENGRGKTTLCSILRSLQTSDSKYIMGRSTLGEVTLPGPNVELRLAGGNAVFNNGKWNKCINNLLIFDSYFIDQNVFSGQSVGVDQRRNLYNIIIGEQGIKLSHEIEKIDNIVGLINSRLRQNTQEIEACIPDNFLLLVAFLDLEPDPDIENKIKEKENELEAVRQSDQIQKSSELEAIELPKIPDECLSLLKKAIEGVAEDTEKKIIDHITKYNMLDTGKEWLSKGYEHITDNHCPFCGQDLEYSTPIKVYSDFFGEAYNQLKADIDQATVSLLDDFSDLSLSKIALVLDNNKSRFDFWKQYCKITEPILLDKETTNRSQTKPTLIDKETIIETLSRVRISLENHLVKKRQAPLDLIEVNQELLSDFDSLEIYQKSVHEYNQSVRLVNTIIQEKKEQTEKSETEDVEDQLKYLKAVRKRHEDEVEKKCERRRKLQIRKGKLTTRKAEVRSELDSHTAEVKDQYEETINEYLDCFNAGFRIVETSHNYIGGTPNTSYQILINDTHVNIGNHSSPDSEPSFKNTLSAGDRSALALAFFLAQFEHNPDKAQKIVVFDDPFNSQDEFRKGNTAHRIRKCVRDCAQVIVLSHDKYFLKHLWDELSPDERKTMQLFRIAGEGTGIAEWDIVKALQQGYTADIGILSKYYSSNEGDPRDVVQKVRPVLEMFFQHLYPNKFSTSDTLGVIVERIKELDETFPHYHSVEDLDDINIYSRRYHHAENPDASSTSINDTELKGYIKRTLTIAGCI